MKKYNCLFEDLRKLLPSLMSYDSGPIPPTVSVSGDELIEVLDQIIDASKRDINHSIGLGCREDGVAVLFDCFLEASKSLTTSNRVAAPTTSFVTVVLQKSSLCLSNLSSVAANRSKLSQLGICSTILERYLEVSTEWLARTFESYLPHNRSLSRNHL